MRKYLLFALLLCGLPLVAQQQEFRYQCGVPNTSGTYAIATFAAPASCNVNISSPDVSSDYAHVANGNNFFDATMVVNNGHLFALRVKAVITGGSVVSCSDDADAIHVNDGDQVGAYYVSTSGVLTVYVGTTATALTCTVPSVVFPGTVVTWVQVDFFKK